MSTNTPQGSPWKTLVEFNLPNHRSSNPSAQEQVAAAVQGLNLPPGNLERLKIALAEASLKATDWPELPLFIRVFVSEQVQRGKQESAPTLPPPTPKLRPKAPGQLSRPGWGFFLIHKMENKGEGCYLIELFLYREDDPG